MDPKDNPAAKVIERLFQRLHGIYGTAFTNKFALGIDRDTGIDKGLENAKVAWADELAGFLTEQGLETIQHALKHTDPVRPPSAREFRDLCIQHARRANPKQAALPYKPDPEKQRQFSAELAKIVSGEHRGNDPIFWATHPRSQGHLAMIIDAARQDPVKFMPCLERLRADGRISAENWLLQRYAGFGKWEAL